MSFAFEIKKEISNVEISARHCKLSMLAGLLLCATITYDREGLSLVTENKYVAVKVFSLMEELTGLTGHELKLMNGKHNCRLIVSGEAAMDKLFKIYKINVSDVSASRVLHITHIDLNRACCKRSFIMGCFMGAGSLSDPNKAYHFEIIMRMEKTAELLDGILNDFEVKTKVIRRKDNFIVYAKDSESIASVLLVMGASNSLMELENIRIRKQVRNDINRAVNIEAFNLGKTGLAADNQMRDIMVIAATRGLTSLEPHLLEVVRLRMENPDSSLQELSNISGSLTKSCINHRFRRIREIAKDLGNSSFI